MREEGPVLCHVGNQVWNGLMHRKFKLGPESPHPMILSQQTDSQTIGLRVKL
jgi:hypothetical protein